MILIDLINDYWSYNAFFRWLENNSLSGTIPSSIGNITTLVNLFLLSINNMLIEYI